MVGVRILRNKVSIKKVRCCTIIDENSLGLLQVSSSMFIDEKHRKQNPEPSVRLLASRSNYDDHHELDIHAEFLLEKILS